MWTEYFDREDKFERQFSRTLPPERALQLARELAASPTPVARAIRLLRRIGTPGSDDPTIVKAHQLLTQLEPDAPPLGAIRVLELRDLEGTCIKGVIFINPSSSFYRTARNGDAGPLAMLLHHEWHHATHPADDEAAVRAASRAFCERHGIDGALVGATDNQQEKHMTDPTAMAVLVANRLRAAGKAATTTNIEREFRTLAEEGWQLRVGVHYPKENDMDDYSAPDPYREGIERLRRDLESRQLPTTTKPLPLDANGVPDPYAEALARLRRQGR